MKAKMLGLITISLSALLIGSVQADDRRFDGRRGSSYSGHGGGYFVPRWATDVGDGWIIGSKREDGGFAIYRWNGFHWQEVHGAGIRIGGTYTRPWHINDRGHRYVWTGYEWVRDHGHDGQRVFLPDRSWRSYDDFRRGRGRGLKRDYRGNSSDRFRRFRH